MPVTDRIAAAAAEAEDHAKTAVVLLDRDMRDPSVAQVSGYMAHLYRCPTDVEGDMRPREPHGR